MSEVREAVWIGVDVGTTGVRAMAYTAQGKSIAVRDAFYPLETPQYEILNKYMMRQKKSLREL